MKKTSQVQVVEIMPNWKRQLLELTLVKQEKSPEETQQRAQDEGTTPATENSALAVVTPTPTPTTERIVETSTTPANVIPIDSEQLPNLDDIPTAQSASALRTMEDEAARKKQWAQQAGTKLLDLETEHAILLAMKENDPDITLSDAYRTRLDELEIGLAKIGSVGKELKKRVEFAKLVELVRRCDGSTRTAFETTASAIVQAGRFRIAEKIEYDACMRQGKFPPKTIVFEGAAYVPVLPPEGETPAQKLIQWEFFQLAKRALQFKNAVYEDAAGKKIAAMRKRGGDRGVAGISKGEVGVYYIAMKPGTDIDDKLREGGHTLLEILDANPNKEIGLPFIKVKILEALGYLAPLANKSLGTTIIPLAWVKRGRTERRPDWTAAEYDRISYLARKLDFVIGFAIKATEKQ